MKKNPLKSSGRAKYSKMHTKLMVFFFTRKKTANGNFAKIIKRMKNRRKKNTSVIYLRLAHNLFWLILI